MDNVIPPFEFPTLIKYKKVGTGIQPKFATPGAACFDIYSSSGGIVKSHQSALFNTGLAFELPPRFVMLVFSRSGQGFNYGIRLANSVGVIDSDYRGELKVKLYNDSDVDYLVVEGDRIAQAMVLPLPNITFYETDELSNSERGTGGLGSTGK